MLVVIQRLNKHYYLVVSRKVAIKGDHLGIVSCVGVTSEGALTSYESSRVLDE